MEAIHISLGGPMRVIQVDGKRYEFEAHPYCGPTILKRNGEPAKHQPAKFLYAASLWYQQGKKVENGLCVWHHPPEDIVEHICGRNYRYLGQTEPRRGE